MKLEDKPGIRSLDKCALASGLVND
jgi:hypothetical protein